MRVPAPQEIEASTSIRAAYPLLRTFGGGYGRGGPAPRMANRTQTTGLFQQSREAGKA
jgi:hypothetical protein